MMPPPDRPDDHRPGPPAVIPPPAGHDEAADAGPRRPLLMDPPGARRAGFAPPAALSEAPDAEPALAGPGAGRDLGAVPGSGPGSDRDRGSEPGPDPDLVPGSNSSPGAGPGRDPATGRASVARPAGRSARADGSARTPASPWAPASGTPAVRPGRPNTPSRLAGPTPVLDTGPADRAARRPPAGQRPGSPGPPAATESAFGPVSRIVTVSVRTPSSRVDLALPDRTTIAEVLETVLQVAPRSLREQALAHGGWILRTAAGRRLAGSTTLLDERLGDGATVFLTGADTAEPEIVYDDVADAVADTVRADPGRWPAAAGRAVAIGATAAFAVLAVVAVLTLGPPWAAPAVVLAAVAVATQALAALVARRLHDAGVALTLGLVSVGAGAAAAATAAAGSAALSGWGPLPWLLGVLTAAVLAGTATLAIGARPTTLAAVVTGAALLALALAAGASLELTELGTAALVAGLAVCLMPLVPAAALRLTSFDPEPLPRGADQVDATRPPVDIGDVRTRTVRAVRLLTGFVHGLAWPALAAGVLLAFGGQPAGQALAAVVGAAMLLRGRLFPTVGERLPLVLAGLGVLLAVPAGMLTTSASPAVAAGVAVAAGMAAAAGAVIAAGRITRSPARARAAEILDLLLTIATIPLVAAVLGAFDFVRGLGG